MMEMEIELKYKKIAFEKAIKKIITYLWEDEKKDYESCESKEEHIFDSLKIVANYMGMEIENAKD